VIASAQASTLLASVLEPGERVIYVVQPDPWVTLRNKMFLWWFGVPWSIAVFGLYFAGRASPFIALPLGLVGIALLAGPLLMLFEAQSTVYAITDRRVLIVHRGMRPETLSWPFGRLDATPEFMTAGGKGGHLYIASHMPTKMRDVDYTGKLALRDLADVQEAAEALAKARQGRSGQA
jgi:hypothetical protein